MNKKNMLVSLVLTMLALTGTKAQTPIYLDDSQPIELRVKDALSRMTMDEKVALCHAQSKFSSAGVPRLGIPELWMSDGPHGVRAEINWNNWNHAEWTNDSCTAFPALTCLTATWNPELSRLYGVAVGEEARYREKDILLGPGVNIYRTPMNGRNFEYMGEDPYLASVMVVPYIKGLQSQGVAACVKHYALNNQEVCRGWIDVEVSDRALREIYLPAFKAAAVEGGAWSFMGSYNKFRGEHACNNKTLLRDILKDEWQWDGVVVTDWGGCHDTYKSAMNGLDIEMGTGTNGLTSEAEFTYDDYYLGKMYRQQLKEGKIPMSVLDEQASRILRLIFRTAMNRQKPFGRFTCQEHYDACRQIADEGIVLLKNDNNILPLDATKYNKILVVGENATKSLTEGGGSSELKVKREVSPLQGLQALYGIKIAYAQGYQSGRFQYDHVDVIPQEVQDRLHDEAIEKAKDADLIIFVGGLNKNFNQDCESGDRTQYDLPFGQNQLIADLVAMKKQVVLVLISGNAVELPWVKQVPAIVQAWYIGSESGEAIADVLSGKVNPSGKLPFTFPVKLEDNGAHHFGKMSYPGDSIRQEYMEDILVGYRWHDTKKIAPQFAFGHGLSYTNFKYDKPTLSAKTLTTDGTLTVSVDITNTGNREGKEVVQLYIGDDKCSVLRPQKELKHFEKIALQHGETKTVQFTITPKDLQFYNNGWKTEPGKFTIYIGSSSRDIRGIETFALR
ncbi:MAG: glycoside hydrolase family 3 C-terminal domain-containing protein [Prevotella sp.]|nr:glycoside hydrolase family 3 C-terminal domain-containing protein [Prevotella sp.]